MADAAGYIVQTLLTLLGVAALAVLILYIARRGGAGGRRGPIELVGRLPLEGRRAVYLVRVHDKTFVVAGSDAGFTKIGEFPSDELPSVSAAPPSFGDALRAALMRPKLEAALDDPDAPKTPASADEDTADLPDATGGRA